jgi:hypothetical protein
MAHGRPWYKRAGADFVMATLGMPDAETKWAYSAIVDMLNDRDRPLMDDAGFICGFTGLSRKKWASVRAYLIAGGYLVELGDGLISNPRFERERAERMTDHERAVADGREGGKKSAALRAAGQGDLDLSDDDRPAKPPKNGPKVGSRVPLKSADKPAKVEPAAPKNKDLAEPPPQARARAKRLEAREEGELPPTPLSDESAAGGGGAEGIPLDTWDALGTAQELARLAGVGLINPKRIAEAVQTVALWRDDGIDFAETVVPAIRAETMAHPDRPIYALAYFDARIRKAHAVTLNGRHSPQLRRKPAEPAPVINDQDDNDPRLAELRARLKDQVGERIYDHWLGPKVTALHVQAGDIIVNSVGAFQAEWLRANYVTHIAALANVSPSRVRVEAQAK